MDRALYVGVKEGSLLSLFPIWGTFAPFPDSVGQSRT